MPLARSRPGIRPSGGFVAHLAFDHQMTPALFARLFALARSRLAHWRTGCRARLRRPSVLKHHAASREGCGLGRSSSRTASCTFGASGQGYLPAAKNVRELCPRWQLPKAHPCALHPCYACLPPAHGPEAAFSAGYFPKLFPRNRAIQRTRGASVREGKTQLSGLVRVVHVIRGMAMPEGTDPHGFSQKPGGVGNTARSDTPRKGCSGGMEGGAGGETQFPITHPPSPVWKTQL